MSSNINSNKNNNKRNKINKAWIRFQHLRWVQPHSLSGLVSIGTGIVLTANTLQGKVTAFQPVNNNNDDDNNDVSMMLSIVPSFFYVWLYCTATILNAVFGYRLAPQAAGWPHAAFMFRVTALVQIFLCYFIIRFLPLPIWNQWTRITMTTMTMMMQQKQQYDSNNSNIFSLIGPFLLLSAMDVMAATALVWTIFKCRNATKGKAPWLDRGISIAILALLLVATYPIQFAIGSFQMAWHVLSVLSVSSFWQQQQQESAASTDSVHAAANINYNNNNNNNDYIDYWSCITQRYPSQGIAMSAFIYVPTTLVFSVMIFGATLYIRKILTPRQFGIGIVASALLTLMMTVLKQEVYLPYVSTQRIYLPCVEPEPGTWEATVVHALDFSLVARSVLVKLGVELPPPPPPVTTTLLAPS